MCEMIAMTRDDTDTSYITVAPFDNKSSMLDLGTSYQTTRAGRQTEIEALRGLRLNLTQVETESGAVMTELQYDVWQLEIQFMKQAKPTELQSLDAKVDWIRHSRRLLKYQLGRLQVIGLLLEVSEIIAEQEHYLDT